VRVRESSGTRTCFVLIQRLVETTGESREPLEDWVDLTTVWASKVDALEWDAKGELFMAGQLSARSFDIWRFPYRPDMDTDDIDVPKTRRLVYRGRIYDITQADSSDRRVVKLVTLAKVG
jgi:head-tail adaptor